MEIWKKMWVGVFFLNTVYIVAKWCVLEQKLLLTAYRKSYLSIGTKMNDLDPCLEVVQGHVNHFGVNISRNTWARDFKFGMLLCIAHK